MKSWPAHSSMAPQVRTPRRRLLAGVSLLLLAVCTLLATPYPAHANPRVSGRIIKIDPTKRLVVIQRSDGKIVRGVLESGATIKRMGTDTKMTQFRIGDYAVIQVAGGLNEDPLDCDGLFDIHTAGVAPPPVGSVDTSIQGGFAIPGGSAATMPFPKTKDPNAMPGDTSRIPQVQYTPQWNPTRPWDGVPTEPGQSMPAPVVQSVPMQPTTAPGVSQNTSPTVNTYGPATVNTNFPATPQGGTYTAAPSPAGNPWLGEAVGQNNGTPSMPNSPVVSTTRTMPTMPPTPPPSQNDYLEGTPVGIANGAQPGMDIVSLQGNITQIDAAHRVFVMQTMLQGRVANVQVRVPTQVGVITYKSPTPVRLEVLRAGDYVMLTGIQMMPGAVEARKLYVNQ